MKVVSLKTLIRECITEVLLEMDQDYKTTGVTKISKDDPLKQQKIQNAQKVKQSYELYEKNIEEMARIPELYKLGPNADNITDPKLQKSETIQKWLQYIRDNGPSSINVVAKSAFDTPKRQQQLNPLVQPLIALGIIEPAGLKSEPKSKSVKKSGIPRIGDEGEELMDEPEDGGVEGEFIGYANKYNKVGWNPRDDDSDLEGGSEEMFTHDEDEPSSEEMRRIDDYVDDLDDEDDELDEDTKKQFQIRAGIRK